MTMNLRSPLFDPIRVPPRRPLRVIVEQMCQEAGVDPILVRDAVAGRKSTPPGVVELRCKIVATLCDAGFAIHDIRSLFFTGFKPLTLQRYAVDGRKMLKEAEDA